MVKFLAPTLFVIGLLGVARWPISPAYAFLLGVLSFSPLIFQTNRKVEIEKKYPWSQAAEAAAGRNLGLVAAAITFLAAVAIEYVLNDVGALPLNLISAAHFMAGAALSVSISLVFAFVRQGQAIKRQSQ